MSTINNHIIIFVHIKLLNTIVQHTFTKKNNKYEYTGFDRFPYFMSKKDFESNYFNSSKLNFCFKNGNKQHPSNYIEWYLTENKNIYEINCGLIFKITDLSDNKNANLKKIQFNHSYTYDEIKNNIQENYEDIHISVFNNDYTKEYCSNDIKFMEFGIFENIFNK